MKLKKTFTIIISFLFLTAMVIQVRSQSCGMFYPLVSGTEIEITSYDTLNQPGGKSINKITDVATTTDGKTATVQSTNKNKQDAVISTSSWSVKCNGNSVFVDMQSYIPQQTKNQWKDMTIKAEAGQLEIPQNLSVGMAMKDASITITLYKNDVLFSTMKVTIFNRVVASQESITTPAGTFSCYKITQEMKTEMTFNGNVIPISMKSAEYYAAGVGLVKNELINEKGRIYRYGLLTKITKP